MSFRACFFWLKEFVHNPKMMVLEHDLRIQLWLFLCSISGGLYWSFVGHLVTSCCAFRCMQTQLHWLRQFISTWVGTVGTVYIHGSWLFNHPPPLTYPPSGNKGLIAGLIKGNQWLISSDHKALFIGWGSFGGGTLDSHESMVNGLPSF